jgi:Xaa-Pro aminopeptidase
MREARAERARQVMRKHGIAVMLAAQGANCRYLTGLRGPEFMPQLWYVLFFAEDDPVVFAHAGWLPQMPDQAPWIRKWRMARSWLGGGAGPEATLEEAKLFAADIHDELRNHGKIGEKIAIVGFDGLSRQVLSELGFDLIDGWPLMLESTAVKSEDEINCLKTVASICDATWYKVWESLRPGMKDTDLSRIAINTLYEAGADEVPPVGFYTGPLTFDRGFHKVGRIIQTGDLIYSSICGVKYMGYMSCTYRTLIAGRKPNQKERDWYKKLLERIDAVIDAIKPGATTADAARHFLPASTWGYQDEAELLTLEIGHGIGLFNYGPPIINRQWSLKHPQVFEPGMTLAVEGRQGEFRVGGVRLENMLVVTKDGAEVIDHAPRDHILEPAANHHW